MVIYIYTHIYLLDGACCSVLVRRRKRPLLDGVTPYGSIKLATHVTNMLHRNIKRRDELLKLGEMGEKTSMYFIVSTEILSSSD